MSESNTSPKTIKTTPCCNSRHWHPVYVYGIPEGVIRCEICDKLQDYENLIPKVEIPKANNPKYEIGMVVYFFAIAGSTDHAVAYPCIGRGKITEVRGAYEWEERHYSEYGNHYCMENSEIMVTEENIFIKPENAIRKLKQVYEKAVGNAPVTKSGRRVHT